MPVATVVTRVLDRSQPASPDRSQPASPAGAIDNRGYRCGSQQPAGAIGSKKKGYTCGSQQPAGAIGSKKKRLQVWEPRISILVYDLGLAPFQAKIARSWANVQVRDGLLQ